MSKPIFPHGGANMASVAGEDNAQWRTFVHNHSDKRIHELILPDVNTLNYTDGIITIGPPPCPTSPIAAVAWGDLSQIRVYYFTNDNTVQELAWSPGIGWDVGAILGGVVKDSTSLYAQVRATGTNLLELRVGYRAPSNPETITESYYIPPQKRWGTRSYPSEM